MQLFREIFPDNGDYLEQYQFSLLHKNVLGLSVKSLEEDIEPHADSLDSQDRFGDTALIWTAWRNDIVAARTLLKAGANPNIQNHMGYSALHYVAGHGTLAYVKFLVCAGSDPRLLNYLGENALHSLSRPLQTSRSQSEQREIILYLVSTGTEVNQRPHLGGTPLAATAQYNLPIIAATLLDCGADIELQDQDGDNALHNALHYNSEDVIRLLLSRGASYATCISYGDSIFHQAAVGGSINTIDILLAAQLKGVDPDAKNRQGLTALELAQQREGKPEGFVQKVRLLLADVRSRNARIALGLDADANNLSADGAPGTPPGNPRTSARAPVQGQNFLDDTFKESIRYCSG